MVIAYLGAACAAWAAMGSFCLRAAADQPQKLQQPRYWCWTIGGLAAAALALWLSWQASADLLALMAWLLQLGLAAAVFAMLLPFWRRACIWSIGAGGLLGLAASLALALS